MTTQTKPVEMGNYVQQRVELELKPGGELYTALSDLLSEAEGIAFGALGMDRGEDPGDAWPMDRERVLDDLAYRLAEHFYGATVAFLEAEAVR